LATALGHIACRRRISVHFERAEKLHKRLKASRLDASYEVEMRKLIGVDLPIIDDLARGRCSDSFVRARSPGDDDFPVPSGESRLRLSNGCSDRDRWT